MIAEIPAWSTPAQLADRLQISTSKVYTNIHDGTWECTRFGDRIYRFSKEQVEAIENAGQTAKKRTRNKDRLREALRSIS